MIVEFEHEKSGYQVIFEDNGRVAYGYLLHSGSIVSDVWLYNRETPSSNEWASPENMPFLNSTSAIKENDFTPVSSQQDLSVVWEFAKTGELDCAKIQIRDELHAILKPKSKPGWCVLSVKSNPIAKPINEFNPSSAQ